VKPARTKPAAATNRLLAALPLADRRRFLARCEHVELVAGEVLYQADSPLRHVYFPTGAFISMVTPLAACAGLEVALVGREGMVGVAPLLGVLVSPLNHLVQGAGSAWRMPVGTFRSALARSPALRRRLGRYAFVKMHEFAQTAACTRFHEVKERLARQLLMTQDRSRSDQFQVTHEFLAYMLGVRRVGVTKAASSLQNRGLIRYSRGNITILDRPGLEASSCGCYAAGIQMYDRVLGAKPARRHAHAA
jgi:CRP-like cAMP-binding protein